MNTKFMGGTPLAQIEIEMQRIPGFTPRKSGMMVSRFSYNPVNTLKTEKNSQCNPEGCTCPQKRFAAGGVPLNELLEEISVEVNARPFEARMSNLTRQTIQLFREHGHCLRYEAARQANLIGVAHQTAAVFLLTADSFLWNKSRQAVTSEGVCFSDIRIHGVDLDGYVLFHTAKDLYSGTKRISLSELTDPELVSDEAFRLIVLAFLIRRYGAEVLLVE